MKRKLVLCILDGWGESDEAQEYNALKLAQLPCYSQLMQQHPNCLLLASGTDVGLPEGQSGNSEVGHLTIGAGRVIEQDLVRINKAFANGLIYQQPGVVQLVDDLKTSKRKCHIVGIISDGGVHGHIQHIIDLSLHLQRSGVQVMLHAISDGRDVPPSSVIKYLTYIKAAGITVASICGRIYAMDRDNHTERTIAAFEAMALGNDTLFTDVIDYVRQQYAQNIYDEFLPPACFCDYGGIEEGDAILFTNYRADRMRQLASSIMLNDALPQFSHKLIMASYSDSIDKVSQVMFPKLPLGNTLASVISGAGIAQLRVAETEKYAHVTYFFNAAQEMQYAGEDRIIVPSLGVKDYSTAPQMSAREVTDTVVNMIESGQYGFICVNYANPDMVGHTGNLSAAVKAVEYVDECLAAVKQICLRNGYELLVISDHGNVDCMYDVLNQQPMTAHTLSKVPCIYVGYRQLKLREGTLADIAPTILELLNLTQPAEMTGRSLIMDEER